MEHFLRVALEPRLRSYSVDTILTNYGEFQLSLSLWKLVSGSKAHLEDGLPAALLLNELLCSGTSSVGTDYPDHAFS